MLWLGGTTNSISLTMWTGGPQMRTTSTPHLTCCCNPSSLPRRATMSSLNITKLLVPSTLWSHIMQSNSPYSLLRSRSPQLWIESLLIHGQTTRCVSSSQPSWIHLPPFPSLQSLVYLVAAELGLPDWDCRPVSSMHRRFLGSSWTSHRQTHIYNQIYRFSTYYCRQH